jgi:hypothetical protein
MTESLQPTSGSLSAKIIRACPSHPTCPLTCKSRAVEDLGELASFSTIPQPTLPNPNVGVKTGRPSEPGSGLRERVTEWLEHLTHRGGPP